MHDLIYSVNMVITSLTKEIEHLSPDPEELKLFWECCDKKGLILAIVTDTLSNTLASLLGKTKDAALDVYKTNFIRALYHEYGDAVSREAFRPNPELSDRYISFIRHSNSVSGLLEDIQSSIDYSNKFMLYSAFYHNDLLLIRHQGDYRILEWTEEHFKNGRYT